MWASSRASIRKCPDFHPTEEKKLPNSCSTLQRSHWINNTFAQIIRDIREDNDRKERFGARKSPSKVTQKNNFSRGLESLVNTSSQSGTRTALRSLMKLHVCAAPGTWATPMLLNLAFHWHFSFWRKWIWSSFLGTTPVGVVHSSAKYRCRDDDWKPKKRSHTTFFHYYRTWARYWPFRSFIRW